MAPRLGLSARQGVIYLILFVTPCLETPGCRAWAHASAPLEAGKRKSRPIPGGRTPSPPENGNFIEICKNMLHSPKKRGIIINDIKSGHRKPLLPSEKLKSFFFLGPVRATLSAFSSYICLDDGHERTRPDSQEQTPPFFASFLQEFQDTFIYQSIPLQRLPRLERGRGSLSKTMEELDHLDRKSALV